VFKSRNTQKTSSSDTTSRQQCIWGITTATPQSQGGYIAGLRGAGGWRLEVVYFAYYPHFGVLAGEVRSAAAWPGMTKKTLE
jgi:hypothetical protein